jgi:hypothetical protein
MRSYLFVAGVFVASASLAGSGFAQAAAEAVITHGVASTAGTSLGTSLGRATGQLGEKLGQQTSSAIGRRPVTSGGTRSGNPTKLPAAPAGSSRGSLVASIQGAEEEDSACREGSRAAVATTQAMKASSSTSQPSRSKCKTPEPVSSDTHPAVINLAPAK